MRNVDNLADALANVTRKRVPFEWQISADLNFNLWLIGFAVMKNLENFNAQIVLSLGPLAVTVGFKMPHTIVVYPSVPNMLGSVPAGSPIGFPMARGGSTKRPSSIGMGG